VKPNEAQCNLKMPLTLKEKLKAAAKENRRSMTAELVVRLEKTFSGGPCEEPRQ